MASYGPAGGDLARGIELAAGRVWAQNGYDWVRPLLVAKVEFDKFFLDARPTAFNCLSSAIHYVHPNTVSPVFYPRGGLEAESLGLRLDMGMKCTSNAGTHNHFRMTFGPFMRL